MAPQCRLGGQAGGRRGTHPHTGLPAAAAPVTPAACRHRQRPGASRWVPCPVRPCRTHITARAATHQRAQAQRGSASAGMTALKPWLSHNLSLQKVAQAASRQIRKCSWQSGHVLWPQFAPHVRLELGMMQVCLGERPVVQDVLKDGRVRVLLLTTALRRGDQVCDSFLPWANSCGQNACQLSPLQSYYVVRCRTP